MPQSKLIRTDLTRNPPTSITDYHMKVYGLDNATDPETAWVVEFDITDGADAEDETTLRGLIDTAVSGTSNSAIDYSL